MARRPAISILITLLVVVVVLGILRIDWGLPSHRGWAVDELIPVDVLDGIEQGFADGWYRRYPPLHYYLLAISYTPALRHAGWRPGEPLPLATHHLLFLLGRGLSLLMATLTVLLVYRLSRELLDRRGALFAASLAAFMPPFVFYAGLANLDVPYVFWWTLSLLFLLRVVKRHRLRDYASWALASAFAVTTKDQILAAYVLVVPWIVLVRYRRLREAGDGRAWRRALSGRELLIAGVLATLAFLVVHNVAGNPSGVRAHFEDILGGGNRGFREFSGDLAGHLALLLTTIANLRFTLGLPGLCVCLCGAALAGFRSRSLPALTLFVTALSYYVFFIGAVLYCYDRFVIPLCVLLAPFGGWLLTALCPLPRHRARLVTAGMIGVIVWGVARAACLTWLLVHDSRNDTAVWLRQQPRGTIASVGPPVHLPHLDDLQARWFNPRTSRVLRFQPEYVVINADYADRAPTGSDEHAFYAKLRSGELGYCRAYQHRSRPPLDVLGMDAIRSGSTSSNLRYVNPLMQVYRRCQFRAGAADS